MDAVFLIIVVAFFLLTAGLLVFCDHLRGA